MTNQHRLDGPTLKRVDGRAELEVSFSLVHEGPAYGTIKCRLRVFHAALSGVEEQRLDETKDMKQAKYASLVFTASFTVKFAHTGKITMEVDVNEVGQSKGQWWQKALAAKTYDLGPSLNVKTRLSRDDQAPRMLQALNTAAGPVQKASSGHVLNDILTHVHAALVDNDAFRKGIVGSIDGTLSGRRLAAGAEAGATAKDKLAAVDEELSLIVTEKLLGLPYNMAGNVYGNCPIKNERGQTTFVNIPNDAFWELMRPSADEITYPWCTECQQLTTMVNYLRGVDLWQLVPANKGELAAQRASVSVAKAAGGKAIEDKKTVNGNLPKTLYEDEGLGPGDFFVFNVEGYWIEDDTPVKPEDKDKPRKRKVVSKEVVDEYTEAERQKYKPELIPPQHPDNRPHISCILRTFQRAGNWFFQLMDTGGQPPNPEGYALFRRSEPQMEGICDGRFLTAVRPDGYAAGVAPCVAIGIFPKSHKTDIAKLKKAHERALVARPVAVARLFIFERETKAVLYATPLLRTYGDDPHQNFPPARLAWSLRNLPHSKEIGAFWAVWGPRGPLARRMIDSRRASLADIRAEFAASTEPSKEFNNAVLSKFNYGEASGFLFLENIVAMSPETTEELHGGKAKFRFPLDDTDPNHYKKFGYVEVTKINSAHKSASWLQDKRYDLNTYAWDQHVFGDRSIRKCTAEVMSTDTVQELQFVDGQIEIDESRLGEIKGRCYHKPKGKKSIDFPNGSVPPKPGSKQGATVAKAKKNKKSKQHLEVTISKDTLAVVPKLALFVELELPVIDNRYPRPDKFADYPLFRGDFPMKPPGCKGKPGKDECPDFFPYECPSDCAYIVKLRDVRGKVGNIHREGNKFVGRVPYLDGAKLVLTTLASCKAKVQIVGSGQVVDGTTSVPSKPLSLNVGSNSLTITVTGLNQQQDSCKLDIVREAPSSVHTLASLKTSAGKLVQVGNDAAGFDPNVLDYDLVDTINQYISFTPTLGTDVSTLSVDGKAHASGQAIGKTFTSFGPHVVVFRVVAQDGTAGEYRVNFRRGNADTRLERLQVYVGWTEQKVSKQVGPDPSQSSADKEVYDVTIADDVDRIKIVAQPSFSGAKVYLDGAPMSGSKQLDLSDDEVAGEPVLKSNVATIVTLEVVAQNLLRRVYELRVMRPKDDTDALEGDESDEWLD